MGARFSGGSSSPKGRYAATSGTHVRHAVRAVGGSIFFPMGRWCAGPVGGGYRMSGTVREMS
jgi:hypothetical protein